MLFFMGGSGLLFLREIFGAVRAESCLHELCRVVTKITKATALVNPCAIFLAIQK